MDHYVDLDRTFHELTLEERAANDFTLTRAFRRDALRWPALLQEHRVVLLSEAGSGKTVEVRNAAIRLRKDGRRAFFVRIEHILTSFEDAFEEGTYEDFRAWTTSPEEGWLLLDSVDEARLRDPKDFERAIRQLGRLLKPVLQQAHIVITGRTSAWRAKTDLALCQSALPYTPAENVKTSETQSGKTQTATTSTRRVHSASTGPFMIAALDDLHGTQVDAFAVGKGVLDLNAFREAIERKDAWSLTSRPLDLTELAGFWNTHKRVGSRLELMRSSIDRRLEERNQDRADARPIANERLRTGARLVAAATTLAHESGIRVPDGNENSKGISMREVLSGWTDSDCSALLSRPIFDEGIYGTVRFHHRSVREYLTAEWLHSLIVNTNSRTRVESLLFREQYGVQVVVPVMRPVLPWLAILDGRILERLSRVAPEVLLEGGDPSQFPYEKRSELLRKACEQLAEPAYDRSATDYAAVQRFASADLTDDVKGLLVAFRGNDPVTNFLLRIIWQGELTGAAPEAKQFAIEAREHYTRLAAFRALTAVGSAADQEEVRRAIGGESGELVRDWLAELVRTLPPTNDSVLWLLTALKRVATKEQYASDDLTGALSAIVAAWPLQFLPDLVIGFNDLLDIPPVIERHYCEVSQRYAWLAEPAAQAVIRLLQARDVSALGSAALAVIRRHSMAAEYDHLDSGKETTAALRLCLAEWPQASRVLFWFDVAEARAKRTQKGERINDYWRVAVFGSGWSFNASDFDLVCQEVSGRQQLDDRLIALTLAFRIYRDAGRPASWRARLKRLAGAEPELNTTLDALFRPPRSEQRRHRQFERRLKLRSARHAAREAANRQRWKEYLEKNTDMLRNSGKPGVVTNGQWYLHEQMRGDRSGKWSDSDWRSLIPEFSEGVARAFRDGAIGFWRGYQPQLYSEGLPHNSTPYATIFGLTGLSIEALEDPHWPTTLSTVEVEKAARFALLELNGFAMWLQRLYASFPQIVLPVVEREIEHELAARGPEETVHGVLYDVSWDGAWMWDRLAPRLVAMLKRHPCTRADDLRFILTIIQGSSIDDAALATFAAEQSETCRDPELASLWLATWAGSDPQAAIPALEIRLSELGTDGDRTAFAMRFITALVGSRRRRGDVRDQYRQIEHLKALYLLMLRYVREDEDINRAGKGVFSPGLRDDAQDARGALLSFIRDTPGKEAYMALLDISRAHPSTSTRPWIALQAMNKAASDADLGPWSPRQVREFNDTLERTPADHRELWYLAVDRLLDLKNDLEEGDSSIASIVKLADRETEVRKFIGNWCRDRAAGRYVVPQEEELSDAKRPDLRFHGVGFDGPVPVELKIADNWTGAQLLERLENQLSGDYLRDYRSSHGVFVLVYRGTRQFWELPDGDRADGFEKLTQALQKHWMSLASRFPRVEDLKVIGIDLTLREKPRAAHVADHLANR